MAGSITNSSLEKIHSKIVAAQNHLDNEVTTVMDSINIKPEAAEPQFKYTDMNISIDHLASYVSLSIAT